ncbi:MAG: hypothetical protein JWM32_1000, partial [Verrucomicrobia bacterium]|nr:hypothetical protein [Verrucomicrobiota bacterium]
MSRAAHLPQKLWLGFALLVLALTGLWAWRIVSGLTPDLQLKVVPVSTVWGMHACVIASIAGFGGVAVALKDVLGRRRLITALLVLVGAYLAGGLAPRTTRILFDEHLYMQIGQTIAHTGRAEGANYARVEYGHFEMYDAWVNKQPNGLPYALSWAYRVVGVSDNVSHFVNRALVAGAAVSIYVGLSIVPWALPAGAGLAASILFMFTPLVLWWGQTVAVEPGAAATTAIAFFAACLHARFRDRASAQGLTSTALFLAGATAFAVYFRPESLLVFPMVAAVLWSTDDRFIEDISAWSALVLAVALAAPNLMHLWAVRTENWGANDGRRFDFDFVAKNLHSNGGYFFDSQWFPIAGTVLGLAGVFWLLARNRTAGFALSLWFALSWGIFIVFYAGGYYYGASSRYAVVSCAPVAVFMGIGCAGIFGALARRPVFLYGAAACGLVNWVAAMHYVPTLSREAIEAVDDVDFVNEVSRTLPDGSLVLSSDPCIWLLKGVNASQFYTVETMVRTNLADLVSQFPG